MIKNKYIRMIHYSNCKYVTYCTVPLYTCKCQLSFNFDGLKLEIWHSKDVEMHLNIQNIKLELIFSFKDFDNSLLSEKMRSKKLKPVISIILIEQLKCNKVKYKVLNWNNIKCKLRDWEFKFSHRVKCLQLVFSK